MPDLKLQPLMDAIHPRRMVQALEPFSGQMAKTPAVETSRLQAPTCYWAVYECGGRRVTFKSFFSGQEYESYVAKLRRHYAERFDRPDHPRGGLLLMPELNGILWGFPFDPQMPRLHRCLDAAWIAELMGRPTAADAIESKLVSYNPEVSGIFAYKRSGRTVAYGKMSANGDGQPVYEVMDRLWWSTERADGELRVAQPLAYVPEANFLLQTAAGGRVVSPYRNSRLFLELARVAGRSLALIHACDVTSGPERLIDHELSRLRHSLTELELTAPALYGTLQLLLGQIEMRTREPEEMRLVPSHGDYKWNQFLHNRGRFTLIDFELFCQAERWFDLGYFCAYLPPTNPEDWRDGVATEVLRRAFLEAYAAESGLELDLARIGLYEATTLAIRAMTLVWQHQGSWHLRASALLDLAIERLVSPEPKLALPAEPSPVAV
ncbi:MAG TPA: aminoglycoside phosphotransferase family protein [Chloroflexota bacterium]|nr:aminoglycoside phosphotransferase family protein [Chloroflexota bacterium]